MIHASSYLNIICLVLSSHSNAFTTISSSSSSSSKNDYERSSNRSNFVKLHAKAKERTLIIDGGFYTSILPYVDTVTDKCVPGIGTFTYVVGMYDGDKVLAMKVVIDEKESKTEDSNIADDIVKLSDGTSVLQDSICTLPKGINEDEVLNTALLSLPVHCSVVNASKANSSIAGDEDSKFPPRVVVMGSGDYAVFQAKALDCIGSDVTLVTTKENLNLKNCGAKVTLPEMKDSRTGDEVPFSQALGTFDALIDTIGDERNTGDRDDDEQPAFRNKDLMMTPMVRTQESRVVDQLKSQYQCDNYISTYTRSQRMIRDLGPLFGQGKQRNYERDAQNIVTSELLLSGSHRTIHSITPRNLTMYTAMLEKLIDNKVTCNGRMLRGNAAVKGWNLQDFMEYTTWPREAEGANIRYGLPVLEDFSWNEVEMEEENNVEEDDQQKQRKGRGVMLPSTLNNPFILDIFGLEDLESLIVGEKRNAVLFLSAPYCRICKRIYPQYSRMARLGKEVHDDGVTFAKADTMGVKGTSLSKAMEVNAVPAFILFRKGEKYGTTLSVSRLPSKKLEKAVEYLSSGQEWDAKVFRELDEKEKKSRQ